jgi:hypothetical protein
MDDIAVEDPAAVVEEIGTTWALTHLPLTFTPRRSARDARRAPSLD